MATETSTKRGLERQELLEGLFREILGEEKRRMNDPTFLFKLERAISEYLQQRRRNAPRRSIAEETPFLVAQILDPIKSFSRSQVEDDALVAELLEKIVCSATSHFRLELQRIEGGV